MQTEESIPVVSPVKRRTAADSGVSGIFTIRARKCLRCGGLLTRSDAVRDGYGHTCKLKAQKEGTFARVLKPSEPPDTSQISLFGMNTEEE